MKSGTRRLARHRRLTLAGLQSSGQFLGQWKLHGFSHRVLNVGSLAQAASLTAYLNYMPGLLHILTLPGHYYREWVLQFYAIAWIDPEHKFIVDTSYHYFQLIFLA